MRRPKPVHQMTVAQFEAMFPDEEACKAYLVARRWPNGVKCPRCGFEGFPLAGRKFHWQCYSCAPATSYRFSHIAGTIFENTNKPLREWFRVVHLMLTSKKGISALQVQRVMGFGSYGTANSICHKIRAALIEPETKLGGIVEVDETWIGGKDANRHWDKKHHGKTGPQASGKTPVIGAVARKGNVIARALSHVTKDAAQGFVREMVSDKVRCSRPMKVSSMTGLPNTRVTSSSTAQSSTSSARCIPTRLKASGRSSSVVSSALSTK
jgi:hypothetical protein